MIRRNRMDKVSIIKIHNRVFSRWNKLSETFVSTPSLVAFKPVIDHKILGLCGH